MALNYLAAGFHSVNVTSFTYCPVTFELYDELFFTETVHAPA